MRQSCENIQRAIDWLLDDEIDSDTVSEIESHLSQCFTCREHLNDQAQLRQAVKLAGEQVIAPLNLRRNIQSLLAEEHPKTSWQKLWPIAASILILMMFVWNSSNHASRGLEQLALRHARNLPMDVQAADLGQVENYFSEKLPFAVQLPILREEPVDSIGGRIIQLDNHEAAYVRFQMPHSRLSVFVYQDSDPAPQEPLHNQHQILLRHVNGYTTAQWHQRGLVYSVVTDLSEPELNAVLQQLR